MKNICLLLFLVLIFYSCSNNQYEKLTFEKEFSVIGKQVLENYVNIFELNYANDLIIASVLNDENYVHIFKSDNLTFVGKYLEKGSGPNEYDGPLVYCGSNSNNEIFMYDINSFKFYTFSTENPLEKVGEMEIKQKFNLSRPYFIDSTRIISNSTNLGITMNDINLYNYKSDSIVCTQNAISRIEIKKNDLNFIFNKYNHLYVNIMSVRPDMKKIALASVKYNRIDIFNTDCSLERSILDAPTLTESGAKEYLKSKNRVNLISYYDDIYSTNKYIFASFKNEILINENEIINKSEIRIFDWSGKPICKIKTEDDLFSFTFDEKNKIIYGVDYENEKILSYDIKHILDEL